MDLLKQTTKSLIYKLYVMCKTAWAANIHNFHKLDPSPSSFPFQSVGNTNWHTREPAFPTEISENTSAHFKGYRRMSKASTSILQSHQCQSFDLQVERMNHNRSGPLLGRLKPNQKCYLWLTPQKPGSRGPIFSLCRLLCWPQMQRAGKTSREVKAGYLRDRQFPTVGCLRGKRK